MRRTEDRYHTAEQIEGYVRDALDTLDGFGMTADERAHALPQVIALYAAKNVLYEQPPATLLDPALLRGAGRG